MNLRMANNHGISCLREIFRFWIWTLSHTFCFLLRWFSTLNMVVMRSSETLDHTRSTRRYMPEYGSFRNYHSENLKFHIILYFCLVPQADNWTYEYSKVSSPFWAIAFAGCFCHPFLSSLFWARSLRWRFLPSFAKQPFLSYKPSLEVSAILC
jgi:hypothetical protein